jgi:hypothetical protein
VVPIISQPDGRPATLAFITVGGRTSAYVEELQTLPEGVIYKPPKKKATVSIALLILQLSKLAILTSTPSLNLVEGRK